MPEKCGRKRTVRVQRLLDGELLELIQKGVPIQQIATDKQVNPTTIYGLLDKVAKENGYASREELLMHPHKPRAESMSHAEIEREHVNTLEMEKLYTEFECKLEEIITEMTNNLEEEFI